MLFSAVDPRCSPMTVGAADRIHFLDGIRGWAALSVMLFHVTYEMFGALYPVYRSPLLVPFISGNLAVTIFFILSGQALSVSFMRNGRYQSLLKLAVKRYPRLAIPSFFSCLIVFILMSCGLVYNVQAADIVQRQDWLGSWLRFPPEVFHFLKSVFIETFFWKGGDSYNKFLWTMLYEFVGSFLVFGTLLVYPFLKKPLRLLVPMALVLFFAVPYLSCFVWGMISAHLYVQGHFERLKNVRWWRVVTYAGIPMILMTLAAIYLAFGIFNQWEIVVGMAIMVMIQTNDVYRHAMESKLSQFMGRVSFPLYLVHFAVLVSLTSWLIVRAGADGTVTFTETFIIAGVSAIVSLVCAVMFLPVEKLTARVCGAFADTVLRSGVIRIAER